jgi:hypothetical protein
VEARGFDFPSFEISKIIKKLAVIDQHSEEEARNILPLVKLEFMHHSSAYGNSFRKEVALAKLNNLKKKLEKPTWATSFHPIELPYYFANKTYDNFKKALDIINFGLPANHPLFISLYSNYSSFLEADPLRRAELDLLKKATLLAAIKSLGEFHPKTV